MTDRVIQLQAFVVECGWGDAARSNVAGDASNRRYDRLRKPTGETAILMDAPPSKGEDVRPFISIARYLQGIGLSAPTVFAKDINHGFLLLEDLGDSIYARVVEKNPEIEGALYEAATDVLSVLHAATPPALPCYDAQLMTDMAALAFDWYQKGTRGTIDERERAAFCGAFKSLLSPLDTLPRVLIQRDYHAENLLWLSDRKGPAQVGLLDFQDAMLGHPAYDLVSVLQDARRDVSASLEAAMVSRYLRQNPGRADGFRDAFALLGAQRNLRILGVFARLCIRDQKPHYVDLIPRVWDHVLTNLKSPALEPVSELIQTALPPPDSKTLRKLKSQCPTDQTP